MSRRTTPALLLLATLLPLVQFVGGCQSEGHLTSDQKKQFVEKYTELAQQYYQMGELDRAQGQCEKGLGLDPQNEKLRRIMAWTLQRRGKTADIVQSEQLFRGLQGSNDFRDVLGLGEALERKGVACSEAATAIKTGKHVTEAADPSKRVAELEAVAQKAWNESREQYTKALDLNKNNRDAFNGLMRIETLLGHPAQALEWADKLIEVTQGDLDFWQQKKQRADISVRDEKGFHDLAKSLTALQVASRVHASGLCIALDKNEAALRHLDAALELDNTQPEIYSRRAQVLKDLGRCKEAIADIDTFIAMSHQEFQHPDIQRAWRLRTQCEETLRTESGTVLHTSPEPR